MAEDTIEISTDPARLDIEAIHAFLTTCCWARGRRRETVERSIAHSLCFGAYVGGRQVGFGRVVTDRAATRTISIDHSDSPPRPRRTS